MTSDEIVTQDEAKFAKLIPEANAEGALSRFLRKQCVPAAGISKSNNKGNRNSKSNDGRFKLMAIFHLSVSSGSRGSGSSAAAKDAYLRRESRYRRDREELVAAESGNMPEWAVADSSRYWKSADLYERANGRLYQQVVVALPRELSEDAQVQLTRIFATHLTTTEDGPLPYTFAVHRGKGENPHAHIVFSERVNDGHTRTPDTWFKRAATGTQAAELGGAKKTRAMKAQDWTEKLREEWATQVNTAMERAGMTERVDHRSHAERGIEAIPTVHEGPNVREMHKRGLPGNRVTLNNKIRADNSHLARLQGQLAELGAQYLAFAREVRGRLSRAVQWFRAYAPEHFGPDGDPTQSKGWQAKPMKVMAFCRVRAAASAQEAMRAGWLEHGKVVFEYLKAKRLSILKEQNPNVPEPRLLAAAEGRISLDEPTRPSRGRGGISR
jgi:MobA/MobL family